MSNTIASAVDTRSETERRVLSACMAGAPPGTVGRQDLANGHHRAIYDAVAAACADGTEPTYDVITAYLEAAGDLRDGLTPALVQTIANAGGSPTELPGLVAELRSLPPPPEPPPAGLDAMCIGALLPPLLARIEQGTRRVSTGWPLLEKALRSADDETGGFVYPSFVVLGAQPKCYKSVWSQITTERFLDADPRRLAYVVDLENGKERYMRRLLQRRAQISDADLRRWRTDGMEQAKIDRWKKAVAWANEARLYRETRPGALTPELFLGRVGELRQKAGDAELLVVVDSLQKLPGNMGDRRTLVDVWLRAIEQACDEHEVLILAISELKRPKDPKDGYKADLTAFKESGDIEYAAHLALGMTKESDGLDAPARMSIATSRDDCQGSGKDIAKYSPVKPCYGVEETEIAKLSNPVWPKSGNGGKRSQSKAAAANGGSSDHHDPQYGG